MLILHSPSRLTWTCCSFSVNTALRITLVIFRHLDLDEGDLIPAKALTCLSVSLTASYPPESSVVDAAVKLIKVVHHMIASAPISLLESIIFAVQRGLALWIEGKSVSLPEDQYNELVRDLLVSSLYGPRSVNFTAHATLRFTSYAVRTAPTNCCIIKCSRSTSHRDIFTYSAACGWVRPRFGASSIPYVAVLPRHLPHTAMSGVCASMPLYASTGECCCPA
jgi:hypothetical protein